MNKENGMHTHFHGTCRKPFLGCDLPQQSNFEIWIKDFPDAASSFTRHPGARHSSQYKAVDKLKLSRPFVEVKNVVSSQDNRNTVHVSDYLSKTPGVGSQNEHSPLGCSIVTDNVCFCFELWVWVCMCEDECACAYAWGVRTIICLNKEKSIIFI